MQLLEGQVIAVTGADSGFGRSIALSLARQGANVVVLSNNGEAIAQVAAHIEVSGGNAIPIKTESNSGTDWLNTQQKIMDLYGTLHGVVHLADQASHSNFDLLSSSEWHELLSNNLRSTVSILQAMKRQSPEAWLMIVGHAQDERLHMQTLRGALEGLTRAARHENMRCNLLIPLRASGGEDHDRELSHLVIALSSSHLGHLSGNVMEVPLPALSQPIELNDLPESWI